MKKQLLSLSFLLFIAINAFAQTSDNTAFADTNSGENELLIQFKNAESRVNFTKNNAFFINNALFSIEKIVEDWEIYTLKLKKTVDKKTTSLLIDSLLINLKNDPNIACVQRNTAVSLRGITPNDTYFTAQDNMRIIDAENAWTFGTGGVTALGDTIVVAVLDGGMDFSCEDLAPNIWYNKAEIPQNGIDDDGNGYIDDYQGWNFSTNDDDVNVTSSHGTCA